MKSVDQLICLDGVTRLVIRTWIIRQDLIGKLRVKHQRFDREQQQKTEQAAVIVAAKPERAKARPWFA
jgi:hypothetical protein